MNDASVSECGKNGDCLCSCNQEPIVEDEVWEEIVSLAIQFACLVERKILHRTYTTSDLRKAGKDVLCNGTRS